ncbi:hypothetical protein RHGRI_033324 [Rhododendron griersonianum]|uniref:NB-ARC domain-containing protein n=1 Tax=Rhododendron griersonianum TaxID=479676 RepID=A0AAV6HZK1_9ERIC|nr:hypothetical protein RHGRI_033324 [Rhododendron griersonianum]
MENKVETIKQEFNVDKRCVWGLCPDIFARIKLGERVVNMVNDIDLLIEKSKFENGFLVDSPPTRVERRPEPPSTLSSSAHHTLDMVLNKLRDESIQKIGIWGMGEVGKTTILDLLNKSHEAETYFDFVIWVTVSNSWSIGKLQNEVGKRLKIKIDANESNDPVASKFLQRLEGKKYLLLLDNVWDEVDLSVVGFPNANQQNGCKVVLTT